MSQAFAKYVSKRLLGETAENMFGKEDPYFETVPATRLDGRPSGSKTKKRRKALPPGISVHDGQVLTKVKRRAYRLDMSLFNCCGVRFGWSSVIGIIPAVGDAIDAFMAIMVLRTCQQVEGGLPSNVLSKMWFNIALDFGIGLVPFLGDVADALFRANTRNAAVLEQHLRAKGAANLKAQGQRVPTVDPSDPDEFDRHIAQTDAPPQYTSQAPTQQGAMRPQPQIENKKVEKQQRADSRGSWLGGFGGKKTRQPDIEQARGSNMAVPHHDGATDVPLRQKSTLQKNRPTGY
jgi:hypothetical protein